MQHFGYYEPTGSSTSATSTSSHRSPSSASEPPSLHPQSCTLCAQRKVKCDKVLPACNNCIKAEVTCDYRTPQPRGPRRRKQNPEPSDEASLLARLAKYEEVLKRLGIDPDSLDVGPTSTNQALPDRSGDKPYAFLKGIGSGIVKGRTFDEGGGKTYYTEK